MYRQVLQYAYRIRVIRTIMVTWAGQGIYSAPDVLASSPVMCFLVVQVVTNARLETKCCQLTTRSEMYRV